MKATKVTLMLASRNTADKSVIFTFEVEFEKASFLSNLFKRPPKKLYRYCTGTSLYEVMSNLMDTGLGYDSLVGTKVYEFMHLTRKVFYAVDTHNGRLSANTLSEVNRLLGSRCNAVFKTYSPDDWHLPFHKGVFLNEHCAQATEFGWERKPYIVLNSYAGGSSNASCGTAITGRQRDSYLNERQKHTRGTGAGGPQVGQAA